MLECPLSEVLKLVPVSFSGVGNHSFIFKLTLSGPPDSRYIRAETCMFLLKLPQYSTQEIMTSRLRYAIHCMEDPLSG